MAVFTSPLLENIESEKVLYTIKEEELKLIEKINQREKVKINIFPNPTADYLNIHFNLREGESKVRLDILDNSARVLPVQMLSMQRSSSYYEDRINVSDLTSGTYFLRYQSEKLVETFRFVKV